MLRFLIDWRPDGSLSTQNPDPKDMQIQLMTFLNKSAEVFMVELWDLLISAQEGIHGIPKELVQQSKNKIEDQIVGSNYRSWLFWIY